jgi:MFS transporter, ACS family, hexuronate transporter
MLFALRVLLGAAESPSFPAAAQAIQRSLPEARRPAAYGLLFTGSSIGAMIAAPLAVWLEARYGIRFAFVGTALVGLAWIPLWLVVTRGDRLPLLPPSPVRAAPVPREPWLEVATSPPVVRAVVAIFGSAPALMFVLNWTSQYLVETWDFDQSDVGGYLVFPPLLFDLGAVGFGFLASQRERPGVRRTHLDLFAAAAILATALAFAPLAPSAAAAMILFSAAACGGGGIYVLVTADMLARVPAGRASSAGGLTAGAQSLAHIIASPLVGSVIDRTHGYGPAMLALGLAVVPTSLAFGLWPGFRSR